MSTVRAYSIFKVTPVNGDVSLGYDIQIRLPGCLSKVIQLRPNLPSWNCIRSTEAVDPMVEIKSYNHANLHYGVHDHEIRGIWLPDASWNCAV